MCLLARSLAVADDRRAPRQDGEAAVQRQPDALTCRGRLRRAAGWEARRHVRLLFRLRALIIFPIFHTVLTRVLAADPAKKRGCLGTVVIMAELVSSRCRHRGR